MTLKDQRDTLKTGLIGTQEQIIELEKRLVVKMGCAYPDGSRDSYINVCTDVLPILEYIREGIALLLHDVETN